MSVIACRLLTGVSEIITSGGASGAVIVIDDDDPMCKQMTSLLSRQALKNGSQWS